MPQAHFEYDDEEKALMERVQKRMGLSSEEQAAEWLVKTRLRRAATRLTGRGRAIYPVHKARR